MILISNINDVCFSLPDIAYFRFVDTIISSSIEKAKSLLEQGQLVAIPTETVYGLAANALDKNAVIEIFNAKHHLIR